VFVGEKYRLHPMVAPMFSLLLENEEFRDDTAINRLPKAALVRGQPS
jgi:hypothetical protein